MELEFSPAAAADLEEIASFIARDNAERAFTFVVELEAKRASLLDLPYSGTARPELARDCAPSRMGAI